MKTYKEIIEDLKVPPHLDWIRFTGAGIKWGLEKDALAPGYGFIDDGGEPNIRFDEVIWNGATKLERAHMVAHEMGHFLLNHYGFVENVLKPEIKQGKPHSTDVLNMCGDCGIHKNLADPTIINRAINKVKEFNVTTYEKMGAPELPPLILYRLLQNNAEQSLKDGKFTQGKGDGKGCGWVVGQMEQGGHDLTCDGTLISEGMVKDIDKAVIDGKINKEQGEKLKEMVTNSGAGIHHGTYREPPEIMKVTYPWVVTLLKELKQQISRIRKPSYRRDSRRVDNSTILQKGVIRAYEKTGVVLALDVSGSMDYEAVQQACNGIYSLVMNYNVKGTVILFDAECSDPILIHKDMDVGKLAEETMEYGGGTDLKCVLKHIKPTDLLVVYTDTWLSQQVNLSFLHQSPIVVSTHNNPKKSYFGGSIKYIGQDGQYL